MGGGMKVRRFRSGSKNEPFQWIRRLNLSEAKLLMF